jgi:pimeloyl-ACP methyl ester carboxylesterase
MPGPVQYAHNGDVSIAWREAGEGPLDVVVVPGFIWNIEMLWEPIARYPFERLAEFSRVIMFDKRGQGLSDRPPGVYSLEQVVEDIGVVMDAAGSERAAVFGISEGGAAAALFAATQPSRVSSLVLFGTWPRMREGPDFPQGRPAGEMAQAGERIAERWGTPVAVRTFAPGVAEDPEFRDWWARLLRAGGSPATVRELMRTYEEIDVRAALPAISAPTLILNREGDRIASPEMSRPFVELIPDARMVVLPGDDHVFAVGDVDALVDEIERFLTGTTGERRPERGLATVLFTDIADSTARAAELGDRRWRALLGEHDRIAREQVERYDGRPVKSLGDGLLAAFDGPARAIRAAGAIRDATGSLGVRIRSGLHAGEVEMIGEDIGGLTVHIGARIGSLAEPGEVLASRTVKDLVIGSGFQFDDRGSHVLKGVPDEWQLYAVRV